MTPGQTRRYAAAYRRMTEAFGVLEERIESFPTPDRAADPPATLAMDDLARQIEGIVCEYEREEQPGELRDYLEEAEAVVTEWYDRDGLEETHEQNIERLATLATLHGVMGEGPSFASLRNRVILYLIAAFQMGRAGARDNDVRSTE